MPLVSPHSPMPDIVPAQLKLRAALYGLAKLLRVRAATDGGFRELLGRRDGVLQIRLADGSEARFFTVRDGAVTSRAGVHARPDAAVVFGTAHAALTMLSLKPDYLGRIEAAKNFQLSMEGPDEVVGWMMAILARAASGEPRFGTDLGGGVTRYTNNTNGGPVHVDVKDGRILRVTPIEFTEDDAPSWTITARGRRFTPPRKTSLAPHALAARSTVYSDDRLLYPMKRVDFDPLGDRHPETRGEAGYERITWDEALDLVAGELMRVRREHGPGAVFTAHGSHHTWGNLGYYLSSHRRFFNTVGATRMMHNPDSWEGWAWGAEHHWGHSMRAGGGEFYGTVDDLLRECEMVVFWSSDPEATSGIYAGMEGTVRRQWLKDLGVKCVHIDPFLNHTAAWMGGAWLAPRPDDQRRSGARHRLGVGDRGSVRRGVRGAPHHRVRGVARLPGRRRRRHRQDAGVAGGARRASRRARSAPWRASGRQRRPIWPAAAPAIPSAAPAARPRASSGRGPWSTSWPCAGSASRASTWATCSSALRWTRASTSPATARAASPATSRAPCCRRTCTSACRSCPP